MIYLEIFLNQDSVNSSRNKLIELYGEKVKNKLNRVAPNSNSRENLLRFITFYQGPNENASTFAHNLRIISNAAFRTMDEEERTEKLKDQFLEGLFDRNVKRETLMSFIIKSCIISAQSVSFEELVKYAVAYEKAKPF